MISSAMLRYEPSMLTFLGLVLAVLGTTLSKAHLHSLQPRFREPNISPSSRRKFVSLHHGKNRENVVMEEKSI